MFGLVLNRAEITVEGRRSGNVIAAAQQSQLRAAWRLCLGRLGIPQSVWLHARGSRFGNPNLALRLALSMKVKLYHQAPPRHPANHTTEISGRRFY